MTVLAVLIVLLLVLAYWRATATWHEGENVHAYVNAPSDKRRDT